MLSDLRSPAGIRLHRSLQESIAAGRLEAGQAIPSEHQLAQQYGISRMTVRKVVDAFVERGLLVRRRGSGTYVTERATEGARAGARPVWLIPRTGAQSRGELLPDLLAALQRAGYGQSVVGKVNTYNKLELNRTVSELLSDTPTRPLAVLTESESAADTVAMQQFADAGVPVVWLLRDSVPFGHAGHLVTVDHERGGWLAARHLIELGHDNVTFVTELGEAAFPFFQDRWRVQKGFLRGCSDAGILEACEQVEFDGDCTGWEEQAREMLSGHDRPRAVFADDDLKAAAVLRAAVDTDVRLRVVGYGNSLWGESLGLTSIDMQPTAIAHGAVQMLRCLERERPDCSLRFEVAPVLIARGSSASD